MLKAVIFDVYGTLVSTGTGSVDAARAILLKNDRSDIDPKAFYARWKQLHRAHMNEPAFVLEEEIFLRDLRALFAEYGVDGDADSDVRIMLDTLGRRSAFPETKAVLDALLPQTTVCIGSTTDTAPLLSDLARNGLTVHHVFTSESLRAYKPAPVFYEKILSALRLRPEEALFVGDSLGDDVLGPQSVGIRACWVDRKNIGPGSARPDHIVSDLAGLLPVVHELLL